MSGATVRVRFAKARTKRPRAASKAPVPVRASGPTRLARTLALAHYIERLVEAGDLPDYATAAAALSVTRARLSQLLALPLLSPKAQERVLIGELRATERELRGMVTKADWSEQQMAEATSRQEGECTAE